MLPDTFYSPGGGVVNETAKSPYLKSPNRLADVIAAIQVMSTYKFYKLTFDQWSDRITGDESKGDYWRNLFEDHPEFFRLDGPREKASLVWRRQYPRRFHVDQEKHISTDEYAALTEAKKERVSRGPLRPDDIKTLVDTAINLHTRAIELERENRWRISLLLPLLSSAFGGLIGSIIGVLCKK